VRADVRTILGLALPALAVLAATPLYLLWDTAWVGRLGAVELASLAAGTTVLTQVTTQLTFLSYGTTARAARRFGAGDRTGAVAEGIQATWVALVVGSTLAVTVALVAGPVTGWLAGDGEDATRIAHGATRWLHVACLAIIPALTVMAGNGWLRGIADTRRPLWFTLAGLVPVAFAVPWAVSRYGIIGSAWATVAGETVTAGCFVVCLMRTWGQVGDGRPVRPTWSVIRPQLVAGRDLVLRSLGFQVAFVSAAAVAARSGPGALAAHQVLLQLWNLLTLLLDSVAVAAQALVGAALGAGARDASRQVARHVLRFSVGAGSVLAVVLAPGVTVLPGLFTTDDDVLGALHSAWWVLVVMAVVGGVVFALDGVLLGAGDVAFLRTATIVSLVCGFIPGVLVAGAADLGLTGVWCGLLAFLLLRLAAVALRYRSDRWQRTGVN
jgi:putative MATE family efflux protein